MNIKESDIAVRSVAGHTKEGKPIVYIQSHGGLHAVFKRSEDGGIESIAAAPHRAIMKWMAEKKEPGLKWEEDFHKSENLAKSESDMFQRMRSIVFSDPQYPPLDNPEQLCIVYNYDQKTMEIMSKSEIFSNPDSIPTKTIIRDLSMSETPMLKSMFLSEGDEQ